MPVFLNRRHALGLAYGASGQPGRDAGLVMVEATGDFPEGRIAPNDTGIWTDAQRLFGALPLLSAPWVRFPEFRLRMPA